MFERFTDRARKVMQLANQEAQRFNHDLIEPEHVILGLAKEGSGVASNVLKNLDFDLRKIRLAIEAKYPMPDNPNPITLGKIPQSDQTRKILFAAIDEAKGLNHTYIGTEHILLGILHDEKACELFTAEKVTAPMVREEIMNLIGEPCETSKAALPQTKVAVQLCIYLLEMELKRLREVAAKLP